MTTPEILTLIKQAIDEGTLSKKDIETHILPLFGSNSSVDTETHITNRFGKILSYLGAIILLLGIVFFISLFWTVMSAILQIFVTLGIGLIIFVIANSLLNTHRFEITALSLHILPPFLIPFGITLTIGLIFTDSATTAQILGVQTLIFTFMTILYGFSDYLYKKEFLTFITWVFGSITYGILVAYFIKAFNISADFLFRDRGIAFFILVYSITLAGVSYLLDSSNRKLTRLPILTYFISSAATLSAIFTLAFDRPIWETLYVFFLLLTVYIGVLSRKLEILVVGFISTFFFITYINVRYFADAISWPLSLILIGASLIGLGYGFTRLKNKI